MAAVSGRLVSSPYLAVTPPSYIEPAARRRHTEARLARNVAVLLGVAVDRSPTGRTWLAEYNALSIREIGRGAPTEVEAEDLDVIPTATLHRYGPETKAALVLAGADRLFESIEPTMRDVLGVLGTCDDGRPYPDALRATVWASLVADAYQAQPALFVAAVQARAVQKAATAEWRPLVPGGLESMKSEYAAEGDDPAGRPRPRDLGILDRLMHEVVSPRSQVAATSIDSEGAGPSDSFLMDSLIDRWLRHLVYSADHGLALARQDSAGRWADAFVPHLAVLSSFAADALGQYGQVEPFGAGDGVEQELEQFDNADPRHVARVVPRTPALPEMATLPRASQEAVIRSTVQMARILSDGSVFASPEMVLRSLDALEATVRLARAVLGPNSNTTQHAELTWWRLQASHFRDGKEPEGLESSRASLISGFERARRSANEGRIATGDWVELVNDNSPALNATWRDYALVGRTKESEGVRAALSRDWNAVLDDLGLGAGGTPLLDEGPGGLAGLLHNYVSFEVRSPDPTARMRALQVMRDVVLPQRRRVAEHRSNDTAYRTSLQVALQGACLTLPHLTHDQGPLLDDIAAWTQQLRGTSLGRALVAGAVSEDGFLPRHVNFLIALVIGELTLAEQGIGPDLRPDTVGLMVHAAVRSSRVATLDDLDSGSQRVDLLLDIVGRYERLTGATVPRS